MRQLFPKEIVEYSAETHFVKFRRSHNLIYMSILIFVFSVFILLPILHISITVQSRGVLRSAHEPNILTLSGYSKVIENRLKENLTVKKGDTLLILNTAKLDEEISFNHTQEDRVKVYIKDLENLLQNTPWKITSPLYKREYLLFNQKEQEYKSKLSQLKRDFELNQELYKKGVVAKIIFEDAEYSWEFLKAETNSFRKQQHKLWETKLEEYRKEIEQYQSSNHRISEEKEQYVLIAPISGTIHSYSGIKAGNFINPNQTLAYISPTEKLLAECYVTPKDIGLIKKNMEVKLQIDAFNYNQWGLVVAKVIEVSEDINIQEQQSFFKVRCELQQKSLFLKSGYEGKLKKGMTLTGRFIVTERTLFQLLYDKVDDWLNPRIKKIN